MSNPRETLDLLSDLLQILNFYLLVNDANNNQIVEELHRQNNEYLEKITADIKKIKRKLDIKD